MQPFSTEQTVTGKCLKHTLDLFRKKPEHFEFLKKKIFNEKTFISVFLNFKSRKLETKFSIVL